jgi:hypothetical protein
MLRKIIISLFFGVIGTIFFAQYDNWTHQKIVAWCKDIACNTLHGNVSFTVQSLNFFTPSIVVTDFEMISLQPGDWSWKCKRCEIKGSWFQLFLKGFMDQHIIFDGFESFSRVENGVCAIEDHVVAMTQASSFFIPTDLKSVRFRNSHMVWHDEQKCLASSLFFNSSSLKIGNRFRTTMSINDGDIKYDEHVYVSSIAADIALSSWFNDDAFMYSMNSSGLLRFVHLGTQNECYVSGTLESGRGRFSIRNAYNSFVIDPIIITEREIRADFFVPLQYILCCVQQKENDMKVNGNIHGFLRIGKDAVGDCDGHIIVEDATISQRHVCDSAKIAFMRRNKLWKGKLDVVHYNQEYTGIAHWNELTQWGYGEIYNNRPLSISVAPYWTIAPHNFLISAWFNHQESSGIFQGNVVHRLNNARHCMQGGFTYEHGKLCMSSLMDANIFDASFTIFPEIELDHSDYYDKDKNILFSLKNIDGKKKSFIGDISFAYVRSWVNSFLHYDIQGEGMISVHGAASTDNIFADITLHHDATIRLPETYNFIDGFKSRITYNRINNFLIAQDVDVSLHTGAINCLQATILFDETGKLYFAHVPVTFDRCLLNIKKDLFAIVSGGLILSHNNEHKSCVSGSIIIDRAQLKENIFSSVIQKRLFDYTHSVFSLADTTVDCDLSIETKSPIRVDTAFLQTNAWVNLKVKNNIKDPALSGTVTLQSGSLIFPYKPLYINKGILTFSPEQSFDPAIELIARNKIKKYDVLLQVAGTVLNHHIMLDSTPPLSEEQITTLLLVGSEESSLNSMVPALILQNLKNLIFTTNQSTFLEKYFAPLLRPFNISLIPSFADQAGRGGLRGMLEISVDDRWKATIQKNFSLTEDTRFELEFLVSDDIALRGIRDERRDLGGEIEMRWKF